MVKFAITRAGEIGLGDTVEDPLPAERRGELQTGQVGAESLEVGMCDE
jgi:hypothetical protein